MSGGRRRADAPEVSANLRRTIRRRLLRWYDRNKRDLPWRRRERDAYAQWVAEVMLQQTRVDTVRRYYERFLKRFPDIRSLARAPRESVLKHWEGLGYYRRAVHLHEAAKRLAKAGTPLPDSAKTLRALPGIGEYLAAAVASIAYGERAAAVDGNVARVLARLMGIHLDVQSTAGRRTVQSIADQLIPRARPGDFNQAWMDLGTAICRPRSPNCDACPLSGVCVASASGTTDVLPQRNGRRAVPEVRCTTVIFMHGNRRLVRRRPDDGLWSGLWEFPTLGLDDPPSPPPPPTNPRPRSRSGKASETAAACPPNQQRPHRPDATRDALQRIDRLAAHHNVERIGDVHPIASLPHRLTHRAITFDVYACPARPSGTGVPAPPSGTGAPARPSRGRQPTDNPNAPTKSRIPLADAGEPNHRWVTPREFARLSVSTAHRKIAAAARLAPTR